MRRGPRGLRAQKSLLSELRCDSREGPERSNPECTGCEIKVADDLDDTATCRFGESLPDGPVPAALPRSYRARRMEINATTTDRERGATQERRNRSKVERGGRTEIRESPCAGIRITGTALEMRSQARRREKGSDRRRHPGLAGGD